MAPATAPLSTATSGLSPCPLSLAIRLNLIITSPPLQAGPWPAPTSQPPNPNAHASSKPQYALKRKRKDIDRAGFGLCSALTICSAGLVLLSVRCMKSKLRCDPNLSRQQYFYTHSNWCTWKNISQRRTNLQGYLQCIIFFLQFYP